MSTLRTDTLQTTDSSFTIDVDQLGAGSVLRTDLANAVDPAKGAALVGFKNTTVADRLLHDYVSALDYGADPTGVADSTAAVMAARAAGGTVKLPCKRDGTVATYKLGLTALPAGTTLIGDGELTELVPLTNISRGVITVNSSSSSTFIDDLSFINLTFRGSVLVDGFAEQVHLLTLNGVRNALVTGCRFYGFRGDGLYIGSGDVGGQERHNHNVTVINNIFDGLNNDNRNGVSVIDGTNITIENNTFQNCTRSNMPGAIDIEPDNFAFHAIDGINIVRNKFRNVGGSPGVVCLFMGSSIIPSPRGILIEGNNFADSVTSTDHAEIFMGTTRVLTDSDLWSGIRIVNNVGRNGSRAIDIRAVKGVNIEGNTWQGYTKGSSLGVQSDNTQAPRDVYHGRNRYVTNGYLGGAGMQVGSVNYLTHEKNTWEECGNGAAGSYALEYLPGTSTYIKHYQNKFKSAGGATLSGVVNSGASWDIATNTQIGDEFLNNLSNSFSAYESDMLWSTYVPVVAGATTAGTGTYTTQFGRFRKVGKTVQYSVHIDMTSHTGTGLIRVSLPLNAASQIDTTMPMGSLTTNGCAGLGVMGVLNSGAVVNGVTGAANAYGYAVGAASFIQIVIPAGAFSVYHTGTYITS